MIECLDLGNRHAIIIPIRYSTVYNTRPTTPSNPILTLVAGTTDIAFTARVIEPTLIPLQLGNPFTLFIHRYREILKGQGVLSRVVQLRASYVVVEMIVAVKEWRIGERIVVFIPRSSIHIPRRLPRSHILYRLQTQRDTASIPLTPFAWPAHSLLDQSFPSRHQWQYGFF